MAFTDICNKIFNESITDYHVKDNVDTPIQNPYPLKSIEYYLYLKTGSIPYNGILKISSGTRILIQQKPYC